MTGGEALAGIMFRVAAMGHSILGEWVDVTNVAGEGEGQLQFTVVSAGIVFAHWASEMLEAYAGLLNQLAHIPGLALSIVNLAVVLMS